MLLVAVVGLVGQSEPGLGQVHQVAGGVLGVGVDVDAGAAADAGALQRAQHRGQRVGGVGGVDGRPARRAAAAHRVRATVCSSMKLAYRSPMRCSSVPVAAPDRGGLGDQVADLLLGAVVQRPERAVGGAVGRDLVLGQPAAVDVAEQIVLGAGIGVDVAQVDSRANGFYRHPNILPDAAGPPRNCVPRTGSSATRVAEYQSRDAGELPGTLTRMPDDEPTPDHERRRPRLHRLRHRLGGARA